MDPPFSLEEIQRFFDLSFALEEAILKRQQEILEERRRRNNRSKKRKARRRRDNATGYQMLMADYFDESCRFTEVQFRRRFGMKRALFMRIVEGLSNYDNYFTRRRNKDGKLGLRSIQKCVAAMDMLVYGVSADVCDDEYVKLGKSTALKCTLKFCKGVIALFEDEYLRQPNAEDLQRLLKVGQERGFPGMIGSIDCMNWEWKNCPKAWQGQFTREHEGTATVILEAVASYDLWIWHDFFGLARTLNGISVLDRSPVLTTLNLVKLRR